MAFWIRLYVNNFFHTYCENKILFSIGVMVIPFVVGTVLLLCDFVLIGTFILFLWTVMMTIIGILRSNKNISKQDAKKYIDDRWLKCKSDYIHFTYLNSKIGLLGYNIHSFLVIIYNPKKKSLNVDILNRCRFSGLRLANQEIKKMKEELEVQEIKGHLLYLCDANYVQELQTKWNVII